MSVKQKVTVKIILDVSEISQLDFRKVCWTNEIHYFIFFTLLMNPLSSLTFSRAKLQLKVFWARLTGLSKSFDVNETDTNPRHHQD